MENNKFENNAFGGMSFSDYQKFLKQEQSPIKGDTSASDFRTKTLMHRVVDNDELIRKALFLGMLDNGMLDNGMMDGVNGNGVNGIAQIAQMALLRSLR